MLHTPILQDVFLLLLDYIMDYLIKHLDSIDSTNKYVMGLFKSSVPNEGLVIWADEQTKGKGHGNNHWECEKGKNLTITLVLRPVFIAPSDQFLLTQMVSVAIRNLVSNYVPNETVKIKWPNDIYIVHDKVAGILIQNILKENLLDYSVIGIGLNINQEVFTTDAHNPISIIHYSGKTESVEDILSKLLIEIDGIYEQLGSISYRQTLNMWYHKHLYRYKQVGKFREGKKVFNAVVEGIGAYGRLKLKLENGKIQSYDFKEVEFI